MYRIYYFKLGKNCFTCKIGIILVIFSKIEILEYQILQKKTTYSAKAMESTISS